MRLRSELQNMVQGEFVHFVDMPWLGCPHDGFPLATSLTAYANDSVSPIHAENLASASPICPSLEGSYWALRAPQVPQSH